LEKEFREPPKEFSVMPFWFWNDGLEEAEIIRQIADFETHGVYGFVIHPRIGLPKDTGWMSDKMISFMKLAVAEAERRGMYVVLYDDGMYPSGSSSGHGAVPFQLNICILICNSYNIQYKKTMRMKHEQDS
jgi:hypothetical protein